MTETKSSKLRSKKYGDMWRLSCNTFFDACCILYVCVFVACLPFEIYRCYMLRFSGSLFDSCIFLSCFFLFCTWKRPADDRPSPFSQQNWSLKIMAWAKCLYHLQPQWKTFNEIATHHWLPYKARWGAQRSNRTLNVKMAIHFQAQAKDLA